MVVAEGWFPAMLGTKIIARIAATAMRLKLIRRLAFRTISQLGISYPDSELSQTLPGLAKRGATAGDRLPWLRVKLGADGEVKDLYRETDDARFHLLVFGQAAPSSSLGDLVQMHVVPQYAANMAELARADIGRPSFYLLRLDGHVGLCGAECDAGAVAKYLADRGISRPTLRSRTRRRSTRLRVPCRRHGITFWLANCGTGSGILRGPGKITIS